MAFYEYCEVWRRGVTARYLSRELAALVELRPGGPTSDRRQEVGLTLVFDIPSKGGGNTEVRIFVDPGGFLDIAQAMMKVDEGAAMQAFGTALKENASAFISTPRIPKFE